jgi:hypothetical protein
MPSAKSPQKDQSQIVLYRKGLPMAEQEVYDQILDNLIQMLEKYPGLAKTDLERIAGDDPEGWLFPVMHIPPRLAIKALKKSQPEFDLNYLWDKSPEENYSPLLMMLYEIYDL